MAATSADAAALLQQIEAQGAKVRELKGANADKKEVEAAVQTLVGLKTAYKELTGEDLPGAKPSKGKKKGKADKKAEPKAAGAESKPSKSEKKAEAKPAKAAANKSKDESSGERFHFATMETEILKLWTDMNAFQTSLEFSRGRPEYNFYDGPPFATGTPHYGHLLAGTIKDVVTRFAHQTGHHVERRFGWDTHGVPVEFEIDKKLGISGSADVEKMGIAKYNEECRSIVMRYADEWRYTVNRLGRWIDFDNDYKTLYPWFMESVWWVFKQIFDKDMVYRGFKVMPFSTALSTPLSNFEANQDMHDVDDPAVTVSFKLVDEDAAFLAWTTTPWTLPSNLALCVHPTLDYVKFRDTKRERVYIALKSRLFGKGCLYKEGDKSVEIIEEFKGETLRGRRYEPLFPYFKRLEDRAFKVLVDTYVTDDSGTGIVHNAPGHGEDDYRVCLAAGVVTATDIPCPLDDCGKYTDEVSDYKGMYIKDADNVIIKRLKDEGKMFQAGRVKHAYAHCWRSGTPLVRKTVDSWFIRVEDIKDKLVQNNQNTYWVPQNIRDGRFHNWLADARDWAFSRNRFWGTPIPIWVSEDYEEVVCIGSIEELKELSGRTDIEDLHREHLDDITIPSKQGKGVLRRVPQVFDCWFESGSMPYAQVHYPFENKERFEKNFPADFIAEGVDQTRGWFYTLMVISTLLFDQPPWKNLIVNGLVLAGDGKKMSKRLKNYPDPNLVLEEDGADALRLYLITSPAVRAENLRFERKGVQALIKDVFLPWLNAFRFFEQQAERWKQAVGRPFTFDSAKACPSTNKMDKWILAFTQDLIRFVKQEMAAYRLYTVVPKLLSFVDNLTNWFIRFNRKRLKGANSDDDAALALWALGEVLMTMSVTMGPFTPFFAEWMYQHMRPFVVTASASTTTRGHKVSTSSDIALTLHQGPMTAAAEAVAEWSLDNVNAWLSSNELEDYQELFASNGLTGADLVDLSHDDLLSMGVNRCTDRKRILRAARKLMQGSAPPSPRRVATPAAASGSDNVRTINGVREDASVHFQLIPEPKSVYLDETIVRAFEAMKRVVEAGRIVRERENIPIKYPLQELVIVSKTPFLLDDIRHLEEYILSELNVQRITLSADESPYNVTLKGQPDSRNLGVRFKNDYKAIHKAVIGLSHEALQGYQTNGSIEVCGHTLSGTDISLRYEFAAGTESKYRAQTDNDILVLLNVEQNRDMLEEGYARELVNRVQKLRKQGNITPTDTIRVFFRMIQDDTEVQLAEVIKNRAAFITESVGFKLEEGAPEGLTVSVEGEQTIKNAKFQLAIVKL